MLSLYIDRQEVAINIHFLLKDSELGPRNQLRVSLLIGFFID